jgi:hypothetical protein
VAGQGPFDRNIAYHTFRRTRVSSGPSASAERSPERLEEHLLRTQAHGVGVRELGQDREEPVDHAGPSAAPHLGCLLFEVATLADFLDQFPEFVNTNTAQPGLVPAMLAAADLEIDRDVWAEKADQGQMYLAAHKLALSPFGNNAELKASGAMTTYQVHYDSLVRQVSHGFRVA